MCGNLAFGALANLRLQDETVWGMHALDHTFWHHELFEHVHVL